MNIKRLLLLIPFIYETSSSYVSTITKPLLVNTKKEQRSKLSQLKKRKELEKKLAILTATGSTIPAIDNLFSVSNNVKSSVKSVFNDKSGTSDYKVNIQLNTNDISWVTISQDGKHALVVDKTTHLVHYITTIPLHINSLIEKLLDLGISFDITALH
jgi:hypothetical protein